MGATAGPFASPGPTTGPYSGVTSGDDMRLDVTLTRRQWRAVKAAIGELEPTRGVVALWDVLDTWDLGEDEPLPSSR